jgi:polysaccharide export outer membrane protein
MLFIVAGCSSHPAAPAASDVVAQGTPYTLGSGDKLRVTVFNEPSLSGEYAVSDSGNLALPLVGEIPAVGLSTAELSTRVTARLSEGYLKDPKVSVEVLNYRPYFILGEVNKPGQYPYSSDLTVMNAIAAASGSTYRANMKSVLIKRASEQQEHKHALTAATKVYPGDTIRIKERFF